MGESPRCHDDRFWMCDWLAGEVLVFDADGNREVVARVDGLPFSIDWLPDGHDGRTLYIVANRYSGDGASDGMVLSQSVAVPHAGRP